MIELSSSSSLSRGRISLSYRSLRRGDVAVSLRLRAISDPAPLAVGALADAHLDALVLRLAVLVADPRRAVAGRADDHDVRDVDRRRQLDDAARLDLRSSHPAASPSSAGARCCFTTFRFSTITRRFSGSASRTRPRLPRSLPVTTWTTSPLRIFIVVRHHSTSGARLTIFMKFFSRSSRATGPKMRVPRGLRCLSMITAALSSKAIDVPSFARGTASSCGRRRPARPRPS